MKQFTSQLRDFDDSDLDPYQFRLMIHYWRVGNCWESIRTTAKNTHMSAGMVKKTRDWLLENNWIEWRPVDTNKGQKMALCICSPHEQRSPHEQECSPHEQTQQESVHHMNAILNGPNYLNGPSEGRPTNGFWNLPEELKYDAFVQEWGQWLKYVDQANLTFTEIQAQAVLEQLAERANGSAPAVIKHCYLKGWKNIHIDLALEQMPKNTQSAADDDVYVVPEYSEPESSTMSLKEYREHANQ